jgi:hypothetical protein
VHDLRDFLIHPLPCLLCGNRPHTNGVWVPKVAALQLLAQPGKVRAVRYPLCRKCFRRPDCIKAVEAEVLGEMVALAGVN